MKRIIRDFIKKLVPTKIQRVFVEDAVQQVHQRYQKQLEYGNIFYSQEGEDIILQGIFTNQQRGFFIDIGAHHPVRFSNTYMFYKMGWRGINIDAMPGSMDCFSTIRPEDNNLEIPISEKPQTLIYYMFDEPCLNSFSKKLTDERIQNTPYKLINQIELKTQRLEQVLDIYLPPFKEIDFISVDVEGLDLEVLQSNNWEKYNPKIILVETSNQVMHKDNNDPIHCFLGSKGYNLIARTLRTSFYQRSNLLL